MKIEIHYKSGFYETIPYFLDVHQFFARSKPDPLKKCESNPIKAGDLVRAYEDGVRDFSGVTVQQDGLDLAGQSLINANFSNCVLKEANLCGTNLAQCNFDAADLSECDLTGANLTLSRLSNANLSGCSIYALNNTDWMIDGVKASHVYLDSSRSKRVPVGRDFGDGEFEFWLKQQPRILDIMPPLSPKVFISYTWRDEETAVAVDQWLRNHGVKVVIDRRDFIPGSDLYNNIASAIEDSDKVIFIYSKNSSDRHYTLLERRMTQQREAREHSAGNKVIVMIFLCIDDQPLPPEWSHRLAVFAKGKGFVEVCQELLAAILERPRARRPDRPLTVRLESSLVARILLATGASTIMPRWLSWISLAFSGIIGVGDYWCRFFFC